MSLNIKNPEAHRLAQELAARTGESMATAVTRALLPNVSWRSGNRARNTSPSPTNPPTTQNSSTTTTLSPNDYRYLCAGCNTAR